MFDKFKGESAEALAKSLLSFAAKTLNKAEDEVASLFLNEDENYNPDGLDVLLQDHSSHIQSIKEEAKKKFDDGYNKAKGETLTKAERDLKEKFGIDSDANLVDLVGEIVQVRESSIRESLEGKEITEEDFKKSPFYLQMSDKIKEVEGEWKGKLEEYKSEIERQQLSSKVKSIARAQVEKLNPVFDQNPERAENQKRILLDKISQLNWAIVDGVLRPLESNGEYMTNEQGHSVSADEVIKGIVVQYHSLNDTPAPSFRGGGGAPKGMPTSMEEYLEKLKSVTGEEKQTLKAWARKQTFYKD